MFVARDRGVGFNTNGPGGGGGGVGGGGDAGDHQGLAELNHFTGATNLQPQIQSDRTEVCRFHRAGYYTSGRFQRQYKEHEQQSESFIKIQQYQ